MPPSTRRRRAARRCARAIGVVASLFATASVIARARAAPRATRAEREGGDASTRDDATRDASTRDGTFWARARADAGRRDEVKAAMREAFGAYRTHALGHDELAPRARTGRDDFGGIGATLIDSLDTLHIMGLRAEFDEALRYLKKPGSAFRDLVQGETDRDVSVFETNIRVLGGLLAAHDLSGDADVLELAESIAARLSAAFDTPSGVPHSFVNVKTGNSFGLPWTKGASILADFGSMHLEWATLSARTKNPVYEAHTNHVFETVSSLGRRGKSGASTKGLFSAHFNVDTGEFAGGDVTFGALGDSFYEYLIKCWRSLGDLKDAETWREMFDEAMLGMKTSLLRDWKTDEATGEKYSYVSPIGGSGAGSMEHLACFVPGMLVLGAAEAPTPTIADEYVQIAKDIARTCVEMYSSQPCGLSADHVRFDSGSKTISNINGKNIQRPETVESLFYLYRKTGDEIYRTQAWKIFQSMKSAYRVPESGGWQGVLDVSKTPTAGDDKMQSFFLAETLKYLYLIFTDSDTMHLDEWVFNTEAHPLRITKARERLND
jgi:mannosyl-oligosaccharide alpha-1,2-mannosidase